MIRYVATTEGIRPSMLKGFFVGWLNPPSPETHLEILKASQFVWLACDEEGGRIVGFINAISDGILSAYIPLLEVLPEYQNQGVGRELVSRMLQTLKNLYMVDLTCDRETQVFYAKQGMQPSTGMMIRDFTNQAGIPKNGT